MFPILLLFLVYFICRKMKISQAKSFGFAADTVTMILFFSVPIAIQSIWEISIGVFIIMFVLLIAIGYTYIDWRTTKEIIVSTLLRKIWRVYFILLSIMYFVVCIIGIILTIVEYFS